MEIQNYIESGSIECFALELMSAPQKAKFEELLAEDFQLGEELEKVYGIIDAFTLLMSLEPKHHLRSRMIAVLENRQKEQYMDWTNLPLIDRFSKHQRWLELVIDVIEGYDRNPTDVMMVTLRSDEKVDQHLIWSTKPIPPKAYHDHREGFLLLEGECICHLGKMERLMKAGDYTEIPPNCKHGIHLLSNRVIGIVQCAKPKKLAHKSTAYDDQWKFGR